MAEQNNNFSENVTGYEFETKNASVPKSYYCIICHLLIRECTELPRCLHSYCRACLERWEQNKKKENIKLEDRYKPQFHYVHIYNPLYTWNDWNSFELYKLYFTEKMHGLKSWKLMFKDLQENFYWFSCNNLLGIEKSQWNACYATRNTMSKRYKLNLKTIDTSKPEYFFFKA